MNIANIREKSKRLLGHFPRKALLFVIIVLASFASFGLGYLAGIDSGQGSALILEESPLLATSTPGEVFVSKNGSRYYTPDCAGANRISDANKIWFTSATAAKNAGYAVASGCDGL